MFLFTILEYLEGFILNWSYVREGRQPDVPMIDITITIHTEMNFFSVGGVNVVILRMIVLLYPVRITPMLGVIETSSVLPGVIYPPHVLAPYPLADPLRSQASSPRPVFVTRR